MVHKNAIEFIWHFKSSVEVGGWEAWSCTKPTWQEETHHKQHGSEKEQRNISCSVLETVCGKGADFTDELSQSTHTELPALCRDAGAGDVEQDTRWEKQHWGSDWKQVMWNGITVGVQYQRGFNSPEQEKDS